MVDRSDDWGFQIEKMTESFPDHAIPGDMKLYYMLQASFWLHVRCCVDIQSWIGGNLSMCGVLTVICRLCRPLWFKPLRCGAKISFCITLITLSRRHLSSAPTLKAPRELAFSFWCEEICLPRCVPSTKRYDDWPSCMCRSNKTLPISFYRSQSVWTTPLSNRLVHCFDQVAHKKKQKENGQALTLCIDLLLVVALDDYFCLICRRLDPHSALSVQSVPFGSLVRTHHPQPHLCWTLLLVTCDAS